jgi:tetratricopeptide (TPR) repeat protein
MFHDAITELQQSIELSGSCPVCIANLARAYAGSNRKAEALGLLNDIEKSAAPGYSHAAEIATIYAALGDKDQAIKWLDKGYEERFNPGVLLRPGFDPLRSDPRFQDLQHRIGLPK